VKTEQKKLYALLQLNTISNGFFFVAERLIQLVGFAAMVRLLPLEDYGMLIIGGTLMGHFAFLDGGLSVAIQKYIPEFKVSGQTEDISRAITVTLLFFLIVGTVISIILISIVWFDLTHVLGAKKAQSSKAVLMAAAMLAFIEWPINALENSGKGFNLFHQLNLIRLVQIIFSTAIGIGAAFMGMEIMWIFILRWVPRLGSGFAIVRLIKRNHSKPLLIIDENLIPIFRTMFNYSVWVLVNKLCSVFVNQFDRIIVSISLGVDKLPIYYGVNRLIKMVIHVNLILSSAVIPVVSEIFRVHGRQVFDDLAYQGTRTLSAFFAPLIVVVFVFADHLLELLGGIQFSRYALCLQIGSFIILFIGSKTFINSMLLGSGHVIKNQGLFAVVVSMAFVVLLYFGIKNWGLYGAILAHPLSHLFTMPIWYLSVLRKSGLSSASFLKAVVQGQWPSWLVLSLSLLFTDHEPLVQNIYFSMIAFSAAIFSASWFISVDPKVRYNIYSLLSVRHQDARG
jgi:O-antigen/teichoic acid export membrane protein